MVGSYHHILDVYLEEGSKWSRELCPRLLLEALLTLTKLDLNFRTPEEIAAYEGGWRERQKVRETERRLGKRRTYSVPDRQSHGEKEGEGDRERLSRCSLQHTYIVKARWLPTPLVNTSPCCGDRVL